jgi:CHASE2 domain-containing sensor protein
MVKIVDLSLDGDSENLGFRVTLTIAEQGSQADIQKSANLPPSPELSTQLQHHWQEKYRTLGAPYRIKPKAITLKRSFKEQVKECNESADKLRNNLNTWLDSEEFRPLEKELRTVLNKDDDIRFLLRTDSQELHKLPWEEWEIFKSYPQAGFSLSPTKYERIKTTTVACNPQVRILAILGNSEGINIDTDRQFLESLPNVETVFLVEKTHKEINDQLWEQSWDILFFAGHSETEGETGKIYINQTDFLTINELWFGLNKAVNNGLKIAIFNSCDGLGLARQLESMNLYIPQMIVMRELVPDRVAQEFLKYFLTAFSNGESFDLSVREAKERLKGMESDFPCASWLPVIWQNPTEVPPKWEDLFTEPEVVPLPPKRRFGKRSLQKLLIASMGVTCLVMGVRWLGILQSLELHTFDKMMQLRPAEAEDDRVLLVKVTEDDIKNLGGQFPLHDDTMLRLLKKLEEYQPRVIGLNIYRDRPEGKGRADLVKYLQQNSERVIPLCTKSYQGKPAVLPPPGISAIRLGFSDVFPDPDNVIRRHVLAINSQRNRPALKNFSSPCPAYYALSFQLAFRYLDAKDINIHFNHKNQLQIGSVIFKPLEPHTGFYHTVDTGGYQVMLNYRAIFKQAVENGVTLKEVLENQLDADFVKGKIMIIGMTDPTVKRSFNTPYNQNNQNNQKMDGLRFHGQMVSQILSAVEDKRDLLWFLPLWGDTLWVWVLCLVGGIVTWRFQLLLHRVLAFGSVLIIISGICFVFFLENGLLLPLVPSILGLLASAGYIADKK